MPLFKYFKFPFWVWMFSLIVMDTHSIGMLHAEEVDLSLKIPVGQCVALEETQKIEKIDSRDKASFVFQYDECYHLKSNRHTLSELTIHRIQMEAEADGEGVFTFDSESPAPSDDLISDVLVPYIGKKAQTERDENQRILSFSTNLRIDNSPIHAIMSDGFGILRYLGDAWPSKKIREGERWHSSFSIPAMGVTQRFPVEFEYEGEELHGDNILHKIIFKNLPPASDEKAANAPAPQEELGMHEVKEVKFSGYLLFDANLGYPQLFHLRSKFVASPFDIAQDERFQLLLEIKVKSRDDLPDNSPLPEALPSSIRE